MPAVTTPPPPAALALAAAANLGPASARMLAEVSIMTLAQLRRIGAVAAYVRCRRANPRASLNLLYALAGALDGVHWQAVRRTRRLELLTAVEDCERSSDAAAPGSRRRAPPQRVSHAAKDDPLLSLRNIGPAMRRDFDLLGIRSRGQLARASADALYLKIQRLTSTRHDPCVWDTYAAAIHEARGGEPQPWWHFTRERKRRQAEGSFVTLPAVADAAREKKADSRRPASAAASRASNTASRAAPSAGSARRRRTPAA